VTGGLAHLRSRLGERIENHAETEKRQTNPHRPSAVFGTVMLPKLEREGYAAAHTLRRDAMSDVGQIDAHQKSASSTPDESQ
jgi:hypothetical protein